MAIKDFPSIEYVRQCVREENGRLYWMERPRDHFGSDRAHNIYSKKYIGKEAGCVAHLKSGDRVVVRIKNILIFRYQIVWAFHKNMWTDRIDHINRNSMDDHIENLRLATRSQNGANQKISSFNTSGFKGVSFDKNRNNYKSYIRVNKKYISLGRFNTPEEAAETYMDAAKKHFGEFATDGK
jgi:hypothetical protein